MTEGEAILAAGALLAAALAASLLAGRLRVPGLVLFLGLGMAIGSDGLGWLPFNDYATARDVGVVALALILFEGGLTAGWDEIRPVIGVSISLAVVGTLITAAVAGLGAHWLFGISTLEGLLLGSILASTDGAAVFAILRGSTLRRRLARTLEGEAGLNDPVAVLLVIGFIHWIENPGYGVGDLVVLFAQEMGIGLAAGALLGAIAIWVFPRLRLASAGLYPVASLTVAALAFGLADALHGSGFLAVYMAGLALGTAPSLPAKRTIVTFHAGLGWLAQVGMFLVLGLLVFPSSFGSVALKGTLLALVVAFVARPLAVLVSTAFAGFSWPERTVLGWAGLRGAVPVVLATFPVIAHTPGSVEFFNVVFFAVLLSTILQGSTFEALAHRLGVTTSESAIPSPFADAGAVRRLGAEVIEFHVRDTDAASGVRVRELGLPRDALLNLIVRDGGGLLPRGSTRVEPEDRLHVIARQEIAVELRELLERWREGPLGRTARPRVDPGSSSRPVWTGPWREDDGDAGHPTVVRRSAVIDQIRTRRDGTAGAVVLLADGRYAVTGPVVAAGPRARVQDFARRRLTLAVEEPERAWWREVIGALAAPEEPRGV